MATKRMTGKDYRKELSEIDDKKRSLRTRAGKRLFELVTKYPDVDLPTSRAGGLKCNEIANKFLIYDLNVDGMILYIEAIEKYLADLHPHKQTKIEFADEVKKVE